MEEAIYSVYMKEDGIKAEHYTELLDESMLPDEGYFYNDSLNENEEMIIRASTTNKPIIRMASNPTELSRYRCTLSFCCPCTFSITC